MSRLVATSVVLCALTLAACGTSSTLRCPETGTSGPGSIPTAELVATGASDLLTALRLGRPATLRTRAPRGDPPVVYMDGVRVGDMGYLRDVRVREVASVRFLRGPDATTRYGTGHVGGALLVRTRVGPASTRCGA